MSTPRKRWFKQDDSILRDPWPRQEKLAIVLLRAYLNTRVSRDGIPYRNAGRAQLSAGAVFDITGCDMQDGANLLASVGRKAGFKVGEVDGFITIEWPKFPKEQDYSSRSPGKSPGRDEPSHVPEAGPLRSPLSALQSPEEDLNLKTPLSPPAAQGGNPSAPALKLEASGPRKRKRREPKPETDPPDAYTPDELARLRAWCQAHKNPELRARVAHVEELAEACLIWHRKNGQGSCSWYASAQQWIRGDLRINPRPAPKTNGALDRPWNELTREEQLAHHARMEELQRLREAAGRR